MRAALWHRLPANFAEQLAEVAERFEVFHFDDGYDDVLQAADALERLGKRGVFFIVPGWLGMAGFATPSAVKKLAGRGHEIGNHTAHHVWMPKVPLEVQRREVEGAQAALAEITGREPTRFAWPYGQAGDVHTIERFGFRQIRGIDKSEIYAPRLSTAAEIRGRFS